MKLNKYYFISAFLFLAVFLGGFRAFASSAANSQASSFLPESKPESSTSLHESTPSQSLPKSSLQEISSAPFSSIASSVSTNASSQISSLKPDTSVLPQIANAESQIEIEDEQSLILGENGAYILKDSGEIKSALPEEWQNPTGYYDSSTFILANGLTSYLSSTVPTSIAGIKSPQESNFYILEGSHINIVSTKDIGIDVANFHVGSPEGGTQTHLNVNAQEIAINFIGNLYFHELSNVNLTASKHAIFYGNENILGENLFVGHGAQLTATATSTDAIAISVAAIKVDGGTINANAPSGVGGIKVVHSIYATEFNQDKAVIYASSATGRAVSAGYIELYGSELSGIAASGTIGVHANHYINLYHPVPSFTQSKLYGKALLGYGVVAQNIDDGDQEYPSGNIYIEGGSLEGFVEEGMGVSTNMLSMHSSNSTYVRPRLLGKAEKGIGISVCNLSVGENGTVHGISNGATQNHFQVYGVVPDSAGINILSYLTLNGEYNVIGQAPANVLGSFGIHCRIVYEGGYTGGSAYLYTNEHQTSTLRATGETGMFVTNLSVQSHGTMDIHGSKDGLVSNSFYSDAFVKASPPMKIVAKGDTGSGIKIYGNFQGNPGFFSLNNTEIDAQGGEYGLNLLVDYTMSIDYSTVKAKANGPNAVAGAFISLGSQDIEEARLNVSNSHMYAESKGYGWLLENISTVISASDYNLPASGAFIGIGAESGIKMEYNERPGLDDNWENHTNLSFVDAIMPSGKPYTILGISTSVPPDIEGRDGAVSLESSIIDGGAVVREEYLTPAKYPLKDGIPYPVYAKGMNIDDFTLYTWQSPELVLQAEENGLLAQGDGALNASIFAENSQPNPENKLSVINGSHQISLYSGANICNVSFDTRDGLPTLSSQKVPQGSAVKMPQEVTKPGYSFAGWYNEATEQPWNFEVDKAYEENLTLYAKWQRQSYLLSFDGNANKDSSLTNMPTQNPISLFAGDLVPKPSQTPKRNGAHFAYWSINVTGETSWDFDNTPMPAEDTTLYAIWEYDEHVVTYQATNGTPKTQMERVRFGQPIPGNITIPTRENFVFDGWYANAETSIPWEDGSLMPATDITLYAKWKRTHAALIFNINGGDLSTQPAPIVLAPGQKADIAKHQPAGTAAPQKSGHFFLGWVDGIGNPAGNEITMPSANVYLTARWEKIEIPQLAKQIVTYVGTKTKAEIEKELEYTLEYTDLLGQTQKAPASFVWDEKVLLSGGVTDIKMEFASLGKVTNFNHKLSLYALKPTQIFAQESVSFAFGHNISQNGAEWNPSCIKELPNFENGTIKTIALGTNFFLRNTNTRIAGTYSPMFTAIDVDYFGKIKNLNLNVKAVVLPLGQVVSSTSSSSSQSSQKPSSSASSASSSSLANSMAASGNLLPGQVNSGASSNPKEPQTTQPGNKQEILSKLRKQGVPMFNIAGKEVPLHSGGLTQVWGLANLILVIMSFLGTLLQLYKKFKAKNLVLGQTLAKKHAVFAVLSLVFGAAGCVVFILTQNLSLLMVFADRWTPLMFLIGALQLTLALVAFLKYGKEKNQNENN